MSAIAFELLEDGRLILTRDEKRFAVTATRCFPWDAPWQFISIRDTEQNELMLLPQLDELPEQDQQALKLVLQRASFIIEVDKILSIETEFEIRHWQVQWQGRPYGFQVKLDEWPRTLPDGDLVLSDVSGNVIQLKNPEKMDKNSRRLLWPFLE